MDAERRLSGAREPVSGGVLGNPSSDVMGKAMPLPSATLIVGGARVHLREPSKKDAAQWARLRRAGRAHLEPWEPQITEQWDTAYQPKRWKRIVRAQRESRKAGTALPMVIDVDGRFAGEATIGGIVRGANQSAWLGYWLGHEYTGSGIGSAAVALAVDIAFDAVRVQRLEATVKPDNLASLAVLRRAGFLEEGRLRNYLRIGGARRDHLLFAALDSERVMPVVKDLVISGRAAYAK